MCECKGDYVCSWHFGLKQVPMLNALPKAEAEKIMPRREDETGWARLCEKYTHYGHDYSEKTAQGWIQWKGTNLCMDFHCVCGELTHVDDDFTYLLRCSKCKRVYWPQAWVNMVELTGEDLKDAEAHGSIHETSDD